MTRLSRVTSLRANRIHTSFVNKMSNSTGVHPVLPIEQTEAIKNPTKHSSEHQLTSYDYYYEKHLKPNEKKEHFNRFSRNEVSYNSYQAPLNSWERAKEKELVMKLVTSYNQLIRSLKHADQISCQASTTNLHTIYASFSNTFEEYGVTETDQHFLVFNEKTHDLKNKNTSKVTSVVIASFMKKVLTEYQSILNDKNKSAFINNPYEKMPYEHPGLLFEERL